ncbi:MAG: hypothetical protein GXP60_03215 [Epsilonproteobacteria bacterium]|nr:hypothetical protein [Campylobacterota bacterium]
MIFYLALFAFAIDVPFGYLRAPHRKFSFKWFLYIHLPIPFIALQRIFFHISYYYIPLFLVMAVLGQIAGKFVYERLCSRVKKV